MIIPVSGLSMVTCPFVKGRIGILDACSLCRPLPLARNDDTMRVGTCCRDVEHVEVVLIGSLHLFSDLGTEYEGTRLEVEACRFLNGGLEGFNGAVTVTRVDHLTRAGVHQLMQFIGIL